MSEKDSDFKPKILRKEVIKKYPRIERYKRTTLSVFVPKEIPDAQSVEDNTDFDTASEEDMEKKKREKLLNEKYPKACLLVRSELARNGKYDSEYYFEPEIKELSVADLSETTLRYLEDWDTLEFGLNSPNLKPTVLREIILKDFSFMFNAKTNYEFISYLDKMNMSLEEYVGDWQSYAEQSMKASQLFRTTDHKVLINHILAGDGRWKSQFETGNSGGAFVPSYRSEKEEQFFGFPDYASGEAKSKDESSPYHVSKRPIYGFFTPDKNGVLNYYGKHPPLNATWQYGKVHCKVKASKYVETTISFGDSLYSNFALTPFLKPHYTSLNDYNYNRDIQHGRMFDIDENKQRTIKKISASNLYEVADGSYTETQIHNGLRMDDIESIHVSKANDLSDRDIEELRLAVDKYNSRHPDSQIELIEY